MYHIYSKKKKNCPTRNGSWLLPCLREAWMWMTKKQDLRKSSKHIGTILSYHLSQEHTGFEPVASPVFLLALRRP